MVESTIEKWTASDGYVMRYRRYLPAGTPRGQLVCLHGIQSHGGWYEYSSARLADAGFAVHYLDRRGAGLNLVDRGDAPSFRRLLDDVAEFIHRLRGQGQPLTPTLSPEGRGSHATPVIVVACSWGGKLAAALCKRHPGVGQGLALLCPGFFPQVKPPGRTRRLIAWKRLTRPSRLFEIPLNDPQLFTATPRWLEFIANDPLALHVATARLLVESVRLDLYLRRVPPSVTVPTLLMLAGRDRIIQNGATRTFVERFATGEKEIIEYPDAHHTLEFEPAPDRFIDDLIRWLTSFSAARVDLLPDAAVS